MNCKHFSLLLSFSSFPFLPMTLPFFPKTKFLFYYKLRLRYNA